MNGVGACGVMGVVGVAGSALGVAGVALVPFRVRFGRSLAALALETVLLAGVGVGGCAFARLGDSPGAGRPG